MNKLKNIDIFQKLISGYKPSEKSLSILDQVKLVVLIAPSSAGRNTVIHELVKHGDFTFIVTDTTREPRLNDGIMELNGREYWFKSEDQFMEGLRKGKYIEAEIIHGQQVSGISVSQLETAINDSKTAITDIDIGGVEAIAKLKPDTRIIMVLPPSFDEWLKRLIKRGKMPEDEIRRRLTTALRIFQTGLTSNNFYFVVSRDVKKSAEQIRQITNTEPTINNLNDEIKKLLTELIDRTNKYLEN
jgi:guanylate kinase